MSSQICRSASRAVRSLHSSPKNPRFFSGRAIGVATVVYASGKVPQYASARVSPPRVGLPDSSLFLPQMERTFIAIKPDGVQRGLVIDRPNKFIASCSLLRKILKPSGYNNQISEIISRFERKGFKLVGIKIMVPSKGFTQKHYHDLKEKPFFNGLCNFLSSGPVVAMVWEGEGVIRYGRKLIGATDPQKSEPGTIRGDLAVVVGRNIIHGSDGPESAKDEISMWFKPEELVSYTNNADKWIYGQN
ncbi:unnamed protein product [Arabis nemorensis]|uniref:Nucleoside diphosphate kinase n=1 Tax=Arabis nemorensis TaxID=586526 RepID=A0A565CE33_9BRAS|nr:unnamed protein product [Arabis nemorensis]